MTKPVGKEYPDVPYFIHHLSKNGGRILEAMVGTGRLLVPLLEAGLQVEGIDASPHMLAACKQNCAARGLDPVLYQGSIENLNVPGKFSAIVVTLGSFMLLGSRTAAIAALQAFARHLEPNGQIFVDLELPVGSFKTEHTVKQREPIKCLDNSMIVMQTSSWIDWMEQIEHTLIRYEKWKDGKLVDTELQHLPLHWFGREEFMMCLREYGYTNIALCANYTDGLEPGSYSDQLCFSATLA
ncbi:bifunctional 2-polyprenyl-6-hydroxyphenol methylase/3-demethylubiquinol 3-O-methyltransferase UbiG [Leptolyngbya sp. FACHB-261]|uniref:class I SAM-dependent methyltransferase n=1 Tax=Leptolyngbya sp. FACHB-261 TaxID=2692806 RepID=UPI0016851BBA|nr:class I SAM-dependent methyltransferase [Leptolyngbya sp. FACHB-261]MBD2100176.1 class I SAM-dependent methyltransferase [Leptolyngbya sp. FACHB-261]